MVVKRRRAGKKFSTKNISAMLATQPIREPETAPPPAPPAPPLEENIYLAGRPTIKSFVRFVTRDALAPPPEGELIDEWRAAHELVQRLEKTEAGLADHPPIARIDVHGEYEPLLIEFLR